MIDCPMCAEQEEDGTLTSASSKQYTEFVTTTKKTCPMCKGFGEVAAPGKQCPACNGKRVVNQRARLEMTLPAGAPEGHRHTFAKEGNAAPLRTPGDLVLVFKTSPHTGPGGLEFTRDPSDHSALRGGWVRPSPKSTSRSRSRSSLVAPAIVRSKLRSPAN